MSVDKPFYGLQREIDLAIIKHNETREALDFATRWVSQKFRDGGSITNDEFKEFLHGTKIK
jgi:hypothetical protein